MLVGGCAGSTSGGIKIIRIAIARKNIALSFRKAFNPNIIDNVKYNGNAIIRNDINRIVGYLIIYLIIVTSGMLLLMLLGSDLPTSVGSIATCLGGVGPGFGLTGPAGNYFLLSGITKYILMFFMVLGRLEIFTVLVLFTSSFWKF